MDLNKINVKAIYDGSDAYTYNAKSDRLKFIDDDQETIGKFIKQMFSGTKSRITLQSIKNKAAKYEFIKEFNLNGSVNLNLFGDAAYLDFYTSDYSEGLLEDELDDAPLDDYDGIIAKYSVRVEFEGNTNL